MPLFDKFLKEAQKRAEEALNEALQGQARQQPAEPQREEERGQQPGPTPARATAAAPALPQIARFTPGGGGRAYRVARTVTGTDPRTGKRVHRTGVGVSLSSQAEAEAEARTNAERLLDDAVSGREGSLGSYAYHADRRLEPVVEAVRGPSGEVARVTVNGYGSLVINATNAMFVDVDTGVEDSDPRETSAPRPLMDLVSRRPDLGFQVYRTLAGWRYLCTTATFDPASEEVRTLLREVGSDDKYVTLCRVQRTFRARLTPKPWRAEEAPLTLGADGIDRGALQSVIERTWRFATARRIVAVGATTVLPEIAPVLERHDLWTQALAKKPLA